MSFFEDTWGLPEFFDPQEELEFLDLPGEDFFDIPEDSNQEADALLVANREDRSINNESLAQDLEVNRANVLGTAETFGVDPDAMVYETHIEVAKLEAEQVGPNTEQPQTVPSSSALPIAQDPSLSRASISTYSSDSNTVPPPAIPKTGQRKKSSIDRIIEEHDRKSAERLAARKAHALRLGYKGIQKNAGDRNLHRSSGGQDECVLNPRNRSMPRNHGIPEPMAARQAYHAHLQDQPQAQEFSENNNFLQMGQAQQSPAALDSFQQMSRNRMTPHEQNYRNTREASYQPPVGTESHPSRYNHQQLQSNMNSFQQTSQQVINPLMDRILTPNINRQASGYGNHVPFSHIQSFNSIQLLETRLQNHCSHRTGQARYGSGPSALNHNAVYEEPYVPLFPERNSWEPPMSNIIHGEANNRRQISISQMQQFGAQQQANAGIPPKLSINHNSATANDFQTGNDWSTTLIDPFSSTNFRQEVNSEQPPHSLMTNPFSPPPPGQISFTHTPKDRDGFDIPSK
ncbi:hypothetical protein DID88_002726 [Monilinia fructigena]|uniref:Uncharacterized protein n=1 Tax=Monilinia fructigena TaxID=38457 RepID=A0A395IMX6_9HELO|nr:hypothetical protein DID88_002726 [Monilinia fructigena]